DMEGNRFAVVPRENLPPARIGLPPEGLARFAAKMATGSGKTLVMALVIVWSYFHARREPGSPLSTNFLVLAPNVIVFERLKVDFANGQVFRDKPLIPPGWSFDMKVILRGESTEPGGGGNLFVTNIDQLHASDSDWTPANAVEALLGRKPTGNAATQGRSVLERLGSLDRLVVLNDEAHHVHDNELQWNRVLLGLHQKLPHGLAVWLDFSATPRFQNGGHFPWIICDYPLAQAVEDRIVKAPMILHMVNKPGPEHVTKAEVIDKYGEWVVAGVQRLQEHAEAFKGIPGTKPVMFVMCENIPHADRIGAWLTEPSSGFGLKPEEVLVIHTDTHGEVRKADLEDLRERARDIDLATSPVRVVVSVMVLREGWDVRNVTVVLGLRPGTAEAKILPEQAVGRGLRLMPELGPEDRQVLEVLGTPGFESFVRELEGEGVCIPTRDKPPLPPITVQAVAERIAFDIAIPQTGATIRRSYPRLGDFRATEAESVFDIGDIARFRAQHLSVEHGTVGTIHDDLVVQRQRPTMSADLVTRIVTKTEAAAGLTGAFAQLYPLIRTYLAQRCFGEPVDLDAETVRIFLADPRNQDRVAGLLAQCLGALTAESQPLELTGSSILLSATEPYLWRRQHTVCDKTIFNYVATFNPFETEFAEFLAGQPDVLRFAALAEHFTRFWVEYLKPSGALGRYFPDWVAVQRTEGGDVNWIIETKGRVWEGTEQKDAAIRYWCEQVTDLTGDRWAYMRVDQPVFKPERLRSLADLVAAVEQENAESNELLLFEPGNDS
ncbi:MAG: DEAD/DEAH box helicase family protein, partial [Acidimicrobiales bacterium]